MIRKQIYSLEEVFKHVPDTEPGFNLLETDFDGDVIKMNSQRYFLFKHKGCKCTAPGCTVVGTFFAKERQKSAKCWHFNLYGINEYGHEILMTKDHIIPKSKGGPNRFANYDPMCFNCNRKKGNNL
jgi:hypothetical protein